VLVHRAPRGHGVSYELVYERAAETIDATIFSGLRDVEALSSVEYDGERSGSERERSGVGRPSVGGRSAGGRSERTTAIARTDIELVADSARTAAIAVNGARHRPRRTVQEAEA
jgi:hypothetical protein